MKASSDAPHDVKNFSGGTEEKSKSYSESLAIPIAIVVAGALIAASVYMTSGRNVPSVAGDGQARQEQQAGAGNIERVRPVDASDHILGNPDAPVKIVEYSDTECPFCKRFHQTLQQVMDEYGKKGQVALVYRHFPLDQLHSKARTEAGALECANELGGNTAFWAYLDRLFEVTPSNDNLDLAELPRIAAYIGLDAGVFNACVERNAYTGRIEKDVQNAIETGGNGTPWSIVVSESGKKYSLNGAQSYAAVKNLIELALQER
jgi:protein-disulfide isomerase